MKRKKLCDEEYFESLSTLFQEVYYPQIQEMEAQLEYLSALERKDLQSLKEGQRRLNILKNTPQKDAKEIEKFKNTFISDDHYCYKKYSGLIDNYPKNTPSKIDNLLEGPKVKIPTLSLPDFTTNHSDNYKMTVATLQPQTEKQVQIEKGTQTQTQTKVSLKSKNRKKKLANSKGVQNLLLARKKWNK